MTDADRLSDDPEVNPEADSLPADFSASSVTHESIGEVRPPPGRIGRARTRVAESRQRLDAAYHDLEARRGRVRSIDVAFSVREDDRDAGGALLAGAMAFRLFLWLLPAALLVVAGLGFDSAHGRTDPSGAVHAVGITSIAAQSVNQAAQEAQSARWLALILGLVFLYTTSVSLVKSLFVSHALVWQVPVPRITHKSRAVAELLAAAVVIGAISSVAAIIRNHSPGFGLVVMLSATLIYGGTWWLVSVRLPHGDASLTDLIPGAMIFGLGFEVLHLVSVYYLAAKLTHASLLYGSLGIAAALLLGLYLFGRLIIAAAVVNEAIYVAKHPTRSVSDAAP
jgi:uncharacterized BrkB/YihY/UPF0761 family membrane protein